MLVILAGGFSCVCVCMQLLRLLLLILCLFQVKVSLDTPTEASWLSLLPELCHDLWPVLAVIGGLSSDVCVGQAVRVMVEGEEGEASEEVGVLLGTFVGGDGKKKAQVEVVGDEGVKIV